MNIAIREPWGLLNRLSRDLDGFLGAPAATTGGVAYIPAVDVQERKDHYLLSADLPGVKPEDVEITAEKGVLTLRGERKSEQREEDAGYARLERVTGTFVRRFTLPEDVQADAIKAKFTNGVLAISIPKQPQVMPKKVVVEAA